MHLSNEKRTIALIRAFVRTRVIKFVNVIFISDMVLTLGASIVLFGKLRRTEDIFNMSLEIQRVGAFALVALSE